MTTVVEGQMGLAVESAKKKAAEVVSEGVGPRSVLWRDLKLTIPREVPPVLMFDLVAMEGAGKDGLPVMRLIHSLLGNEQFIQVRGVVADIADSEGQIGAISDLVTSLLTELGTSLGNSLASSGHWFPGGT